MFFTCLAAQNTDNNAAQSLFFKNEIKFSIGDSYFANKYWSEMDNDFDIGSFSLGYLHRPLQWLWVGGYFNLLYGKEEYNWVEYYRDGTINEFQKITPHYAISFAPEIRFSYLNTKFAILYASGAYGVAWEYGRRPTQKHSFWQVTFLGGSFGNRFRGGFELGVGYKGIFNIHLSYNF